MNGKELSEVVAEAAARTERAAARTETARAEIEVSRARIEVSRAGIEAVRKRQEDSTAEHRVTMERLEKQWAESAARSEKMIEESGRRFDQIVAELRDQRDERRALIEALLQMVDRLPPPPPQLRSAEGRQAQTRSS